MGFVGTAAGRTAIARLGLLQAGMLATSLQASLLFGAWVVYKCDPVPGRNPMLAGSYKTSIIQACFQWAPLPL